MPAATSAHAAEDARGEVEDTQPTELTDAEFGTKHTQWQADYAAGIEQLGQGATAMCDNLVSFAGQIGGAGAQYSTTESGAASTVTAPREWAVSRSWQEVQTLLDDPFVDADTKEHLLAAYIKENVRGYPFIEEDDLPDDVRRYYDQYPTRSGDFDQGSLDDVYDDAQAESDERGYSDRPDAGRDRPEHVHFGWFAGAGGGAVHRRGEVGRDLRAGPAGVEGVREVLAGERQGAG